VAPAGGREAGPLGAGKRGQAASPRGAERANVYAQVERGLAQLLKSEGGTTTLRLTPHTLGSVRVELSVRGGEASATIVPSSDVARSLLEGSLDELRSALEARGVRVARLEVAPVAQNMPAEAGRGAEQPRDGAGGDPRGDAGAEDRPGQRGMSGDGRSGDGGTPRHGRMTGTPRSGEDPGQATPTAEPAGTSAERGAWWVGLDAVA
jgi:flagellar hook-length control protein FliK